MTIGVRPIGTMAIGDSTAFANAPSAAPVVNGSAVLAGAGTFAGTAATGTKYGQSVLSGVATIVAVAMQEVLGYAVLNGYASMVGSVPIVQTSDPSQQRIQYRIIVVDFQGNRYGDLENARLSNIVWELNGIHSCEFTMPVLDPKARLIKTPEREVQIWRGNTLLDWFVITGARVQGGELTVQCKGLRWYLTRRFFGKADRKNYMPNGSFEQNMKNWTFSYNPVEHVSNIGHNNYTKSITQHRVVTGTKALRIQDPTGPAPVYGIDVTQAFIHTVSDEIDPKGTIWTVAVWIYIESFVSSTVRAKLLLGRYSTTQTVSITRPGTSTPAIYPKPIANLTIPIDEETPRQTWTRMEIELTQPFKADEPEWVQVLLTCPRGEIYIDEVSLTAAEKTAFYDKDQALIVQGIIDHCQDPAYGKSTLNFQKNIPLTGVIRTREFWHSEHQNCGDALDEFASLYEGMDSEIIVTPTTRTYTTYYPYKGISRPSVVLEYGRNLSDFSVEYSGEDTANSVVVLGDGEGSDREEGGSIDPTALDGGLILEKVYNATPGSHIKTLDQQAQRGVNRFKKPVVIPSVTTVDNSGHLIEQLRVGDVVPVRIDYGFVQINEDFRIMAMALDPASDQVTFTINPASSSFLAAPPPPPSYPLVPA